MKWPAFSFGWKDFSDERLMTRIAAGADERAFGVLYRRYAGCLQRFFLRMFPGEEALADDLVQETFLRLWAARRSYGEGRAVRPWIFTVAYNLGRNEWRRRGKVLAYAEEALHLSDEAYEELPEVRLDAADFDRALARELALLSTERRVLFALRFEEELTVREVAEALCIPEGTAKSRLHTLVYELREKLKQYEKL